MRNILLVSLPLTFVALSGCGSEPRGEPTDADLKRDLTLVTSDVQPVASPIELGEVRTERGKSAPSRVAVRQRRALHRAALHPTTRVYEPSSSAETARPAIADVAVPHSGPAAIPADSHELPPGRTISVIPVMNGPSPSADRGDDMPLSGTGGSGMGGGGSGMGGGGSGMGGGCPGRGTPGISTARPRGLLY